MKYTRFEDLPVWRGAAAIGRIALSLADEPAFTRRRGGADQFERAALSISNNIAEGFESGTTNQLITYLYIARGSAGEMRSMLRILARVPAFSNLKSQISDLIPQCESVSRQLRAWADSLQNSDIPGPRHLNDLSRDVYVRRAKAKEFLAGLKRLTSKPNGNADR